MKITVEMHYSEEFVPPRCRTPQQRAAQEGVSLKVAETTAQRAPVALVVHEREGDIPLRWYRGQLFKPSRVEFDDHSRTFVRRPRTPEDIADQLRGIAAQSGWRTREVGLDALNQKAAHYLLVDGKVWETSREPRYQIKTYGFNNGTSLYVGYDREPQPPDGRWAFCALERDAAIANALATAGRRGDPQESIDAISAVPWIEVLIPSAVKLPTLAKLAEIERRRRRTTTLRVTCEVVRDDGRPLSRKLAQAVVREYFANLGRLDYRDGDLVLLDGAVCRIEALRLPQANED